MSITFFLSLCVLAVCGHGQYQLTLEPHITAFRRVGSLTDGVAHAHIALQFDLQAEQQVVQDLSDDLAKISRNSSVPMWAPVVHEVTPLLRDWRNFREELRGTPASSPPRHRRQVLIGIALGTVVAASAGAGLFALEETHKLQARMDGKDAQVAHMLAAANSSLRVEHQLIADVSNLKRAVMNIQNSVGDLENAVLISESVHSLAYRVKHRLQGFKGVWNHRLHSDLLSSDQLHHVFDLMVRRAAKLGYELVMEGAHQLHRVELSYTLEGNKLVIFLHVPVTSSKRDNRLALYQHVELPVRFNSTYALINGPTSLLAVDTLKQGFVELSANDLQGCHQDGMDFSCSTSFPRTRGGRTSCLSALYLNNHDSAKEWCSINRINQRSAVFRVNQTAFVMIAQDKITLNIECDGEDMQALQVEGLALLQLASHCAAVADDFVFAAAERSLPGDLHITIAAPAAFLIERLRDFERKFEVNHFNFSDSEQEEFEEEDNTQRELRAAGAKPDGEWSYTTKGAVVLICVCSTLLLICWSSSLRLNHRAAASVGEFIQARINEKIARDFVDSNWKQAPLVPPSTPVPIRGGHDNEAFEMSA